MPRRPVWLLALAALALAASPALADKYDEKEINEESEVIVGKYDEDDTTASFGGKWPITKGVLGCIDYDAEAGECVECLEPYFTPNGGVCDCTPGFGLAPFAYGKSHKPKLMVCAPCPDGTFSLGGTYSVTICQRCPLGSTTSAPFAAAADDCDVCLPGFAGEPPGTPCALCPAGTYAEDGATECADCPEGFTTPKAGSVSEDQCYIAVCDEDEQSVKGECYPCAEGYVSDAGNAAFGKYQPKCVKDVGPRNQKPLYIPTGKLYEDVDGYVGEQKIKEPVYKVPDYDKVPKIKGVDTGYDKHADEEDEVVVNKKTA